MYRDGVDRYTEYIGSLNNDIVNSVIGDIPA